MKPLGLAAFTFSLLTVVAVHAGDDAAQKKDKAALQGVWKIVSLETSKGKDPNAEGATLEFDKDGKNLVYTKDGESKKATYTLNPSGKPKEIDIKVADENKTFEAIYQVEKDKLKICLAPESGDGRPNEFAVKDGKNYILIQLEKSK